MKPAYRSLALQTIVSGIIIYCIIYFTVAKFQARRRERLAERARARLAEALQGSSI